MSIIRDLFYSFVGLLCGEAAICTILLVTKSPDFMRFYRYMGYIYFPVYGFIRFLLPFTTYAIIKKVFKMRWRLSKGSFFIMGAFFSLGYMLLNKFMMKPWREGIVKSAPPQIIKHFIYFIMPWFILPLFLFWVIFIAIEICKLNKLQIENRG